MADLWRTYNLWYQLLVSWAALLLPEDAAKRAARSALAAVWYSALNAVENLDGPYMASSDLLYAAVCMLRDPVEDGLTTWAYQEMPYPDEQTVRDIARLYATVFEVGHAACLSLHERTEIWALIRLYDPQEMSTGPLKRAILSTLPATHPLRRVVSSIMIAPEADQHVQRAAVELWEGEEQRGLAWLKRQTIENGAT